MMKLLKGALDCLEKIPDIVVSRTVAEGAHAQ